MAKTTTKARSLFAAAMAMVGANAWAADIKVLGTNTRGDLVLGLNGEIVADDLKQFVAATATLPKVVVQLNSPGGLVGEAIGIAQIVRARGFAVSVAPKTRCASACALIWLSAAERYASATGQVGFHAVYRKEDHAVAGSGNALVGAYFARMGVRDSVIAYITNADPREMNWLTAAKAKELGIIIQPEPAAFYELRTVSGPAPGFVSYRAVVPAKIAACEHDTMKALMDKTANSDAPNTDGKCKQIADQDIVTVEELDGGTAMACVRRSIDTACLWTPLAATQIQVGMPASAPRPPAAPLPLAEVDDVEICRRAVSSRTGRWNPDENLAVVSALRRGYNTPGTCKAKVACATPADVASAKRLSAIACEADVFQTSTTDLCRAVLPDVRDDNVPAWRTEPSFLYATEELQRRRVTPRACAEMIPATAAAKPAAPEPVAAKPSAPESVVAKPAAPDAVAGTPVSPSREALGLALMRAVPRINSSTVEPLLTAYMAAEGVKALAVSEKGGWVWTSSVSTDLATLERLVLERCQIRANAKCGLAAINNALTGEVMSGSLNAFDMPRVSYTGPFDIGMIPGVANPQRRPEVRTYAEAQGGKAIALHPSGDLSVITNAADQQTANQKALEACTTDATRQARSGACLLYAEGDAVVLTQRRLKAE